MSSVIVLYGWYSKCSPAFITRPWNRHRYTPGNGGMGGSVSIRACEVTAGNGWATVRSCAGKKEKQWIMKKYDVYSKRNEERWVSVVQLPSLCRSLPSSTAEEDYRARQLTDTWGILLINTLVPSSSLAPGLWRVWSGGSAAEGGNETDTCWKRVKSSSVHRDATTRGSTPSEEPVCTFRCLRLSSDRGVPRVNAPITGCRWVMLSKRAVPCTDARGHQGDGEQTLYSD